MPRLTNSELTLGPLLIEGTDQEEKLMEAMVERVHVPSVVEAAARAIRKAIVTRKLLPGTRLVERDLATALGIGQPTLREALKELEYEGFVRKTPQRGTYVSSLTSDDVRKVLEVRIVLEAFAVERAAANMTANAELKLGGWLGQMSVAANSSNLEIFHDADVGFHREVWALAGNEYLSASLEGIALRLFVFGTLSHGYRDDAELFLAAVEQHKRILEGLCSRDPEKARATFVSETLHFWNASAHLDVNSCLPAVYGNSGA